MAIVPADERNLYQGMGITFSWRPPDNIESIRSLMSRECASELYFSAFAGCERWAISYGMRGKPYLRG